MNTSAGDVAITVGEFRWRGDSSLTPEVIAKLRPLAEAAGGTALKVLEEHGRVGTTPELSQDGFYGVPRVLPKGSAFNVWFVVRRIAVHCREILVDRVPLSDETTLALASVGVMCEEIATRGDLTYVGQAHGMALAPVFNSFQDLTTKWVNAGTTAPEIRQALANNKFPKMLSECATALSSILGWLAFHAQSAGVDGLITEQREHLQESLGKVRTDLGNELAAAQKHNADLAAANRRADAILATIEGASGAKAADVFKTSFEATANEHATAARYWVAAATVFSLAAIVTGCVFVAMTWEQGTTVPHWEQVVTAAVPRILLVSVLLSPAFFSARMFTMHRRSEHADRHRVNALKSFSALIGAAGTNERSKAAILSALTACVFGHTPDVAPEPSLPIVGDSARSVREAASV